MAFDLSIDEMSKTRPHKDTPYWTDPMKGGQIFSFPILQILSKVMLKFASVSEATLSRGELGAIGTTCT